MEQPNNMDRPARILVVEDNDTNLMIFTDILRAAGHEVLTARTAEEAFGVVRNRPPDLILMDLQLPGMSGLDAVRTFKGNPDTRPIPIVAVTAHAMAAHRERAIEAGCSGYITKPIRSKEFREQVASYLKGRAGKK